MKTDPQKAEELFDGALRFEPDARAAFLAALGGFRSDRQYIPFLARTDFGAIDATENRKEKRISLQ